MQKFTLEPDCCRVRQQRLLELIRDNDLSGAIVLQNVHVQWLTGAYFPSVFCSAGFLDAEGTMTLVAPHKLPQEFVADVADRYDAKWHSTMRNDQNLACLEKLVSMIGQPKGTIGCEFSTYGEHARNLLGDQTFDIEPSMLKYRRRKEKDELDRIRYAIGATEKMYEAAREMIRPGVSEIEVFNQLQTVAVEHFGEPLTGTGNDYQCGSRGGPPRNQRIAEEGELYILDLGPAFRGYFADNARTIAVTEPTDQQMAAWEMIMKVFEHVENNAKPGKSCVELFDEVQKMLDQSPVGVFNHHLGHGIGLFPHEGPHLNPHWDDTFQVGDVFTAEPGLYDVELLRAGMRLENDYVITENGVENLTPFPLEL